MIKIIMLRIYSTVEIGAIKMYVIINHMIKHHATYSFEAQFKWIMGFTVVYKFTNVDS